MKHTITVLVEREGEAPVEMLAETGEPEDKPRMVKIGEGVAYHCADAPDGRWIYRFTAH